MSGLGIKTLSIIILLLEQLMVCESRSCSWSKKSARTVDSCPESKEELQERINIKNCASLAAFQNCTEPAKFQYHCLIDEAEKNFMEVCVPVYNILLGYCAEYNTIGALVQQHRGLKCSDMNPPCPELYKSTDAYLYKGCYEIVKRRRTTSSDITSELSTKFTTKEKYEISSPSLENIGLEKPSNAGIILTLIYAVVGFLLFATVTVFMIVRCKIHRRKRELRNGEGNKKGANDTSDEREEMLSVTVDDDKIKLTNSSPKQRVDTLPTESSDSSSEKSESDMEKIDTEDEKVYICNKEEYKEEIERAKSLRDTVAVKDMEMAENIERRKGDASSFLKAYKDVRKHFVKTGLLKECQTSLLKNGFTILSGQQGSGKTLSAVYIMSKNRHYKDWTKLKFSSWEDLLTLELKSKTLVYIDNLFDGYMYMYPQEIRKWWCSLCYFYFEKIQSKKGIHLLITAKDDVMKEACEQIKTNIDENPFYLKVDQFPLTDEERKKILDSQFKLAKKLKKLDNPEIASTYADIKENDKSCAVGFPLCAHLYAFEPDRVFKTKDIFTDPVSYVIRHFEREIKKDKGNGVKTLFLFLLFYTSPSSLKPSKKLDLRYGKELREYLEDPKMVSENLVREMEPLNFDNLLEVAKRLKYTILVEQSTMFEFKHQIYLDGASDYFLRKFPDVAVRNFPLNIIRSYAFPDSDTSVWHELINRFKRELKKNINFQESKRDVDSWKTMIPEILSFKIFDKEQFEIKFGYELKKDGALNCLLLIKELSFPFWASRFDRKILSQAALFSSEEHWCYQFYQGIYGECCKKEKRYYSDSSANMDLDRLKERVWDFKTSDGKSVLHLVLRSDRSDYEAHLILARMLNDTTEQDVSLINDLLNCALEHMTCSRILCILELLHRQTELCNELKHKDVSNIIALLKESEGYEVYMELEFLVRICIISANDELPNEAVKIEFHSIDVRFQHLKDLLNGTVNTQSRMTKLITDCVAECQTPLSACPETKHIPFTKTMSSELKRAIYNSVKVLSRRKKLLEN